MKLRTASGIAALLLLAGCVIEAGQIFLPGGLFDTLPLVYGNEEVSREVHHGRQEMVRLVRGLAFFYLPCLLFFSVLHFRTALRQRGR